MHSGQWNYQSQIANCSLCGVLACMNHSYCGGLVNIPVKRAKVLNILAQAQNQWQKQAYCWTLFSIQDLHLASSRWQPYDFNDVASLMVLAQTLWPVWLLQGEGTLIVVCPWHMTSDINWLNPIKDDYVYQVRSLKLKSYSCIFITQYNNNVQIVIFRDQPWNLTSYLDKK